jgi:hypothetical protein
MTDTAGDGGGGGGVTKHHSAVTPGVTVVNWNLGTPGQIYPSVVTPTASTANITVGNVTTNLVANPGTNGNVTTAGVGGNATGGNIGNYTGHNGARTNTWDGGGNGLDLTDNTTEDGDSSALTGVGAPGGSTHPGGLPMIVIIARTS